MGFPNTELIAPAILWNNPGITKEEFAELLDNTHSSSKREYKPDEAWGYYDPEREDSRFRNGLERLALILGIKESKEYREFQSPSKPCLDKNGLVISPPRLLPLAGLEEEFGGNSYAVVVHEENVLYNTQKVHRWSYARLKVGEVCKEPTGTGGEGIVREIYNETFRESIDDDDDDYIPHWRYAMKITMLERKLRDDLFKTEEELWEQWPLFSPSYMYDWNQPEGHFYAGPWIKDNFLWINQEGRYYFDPRTFDRLPASIRSGSLGYTDLVLTRGALRHNAWKILSYDGLKYFPAFLNDFPDVRSDYERSCWDAHTSLYAREQKMTVLEFLRFRLEPTGL